MSPEIIIYKKQFNVILEPIKVMLISKRDTLDQNDWMALVDRTESSVIRNPEQYLGKELPEQESLAFIVKNIFRDFRDNLNSNLLEIQPNEEAWKSN